MKLEISEIIHRVGHQVTVDINEPCPADADFRCTAPIHGKLTLTNTSHHLLVRGDLATTVVAECARCLKEVLIPVKAQIEEEFPLPKIDARGAAHWEIEGEPSTIVEDYTSIRANWPGSTSRWPCRWHRCATMHARASARRAARTSTRGRANVRWPRLTSGWRACVPCWKRAKKRERSSSLAHAAVLAAQVPAEREPGPGIPGAIPEEALSRRASEPGVIELGKELCCGAT